MQGRVFRFALTLGLVLSAFAGLAGPAGASHADLEGPGIGPPDDASAAHAYLPWVPSGAELGDQGPFYGTVTVQNLERTPVIFDIFVGGQHQHTAYSMPRQSVTFSAADLGIAGDGQSVAVHGYQHRGNQAGTSEVVCVIEYADGHQVEAPMGGYTGGSQSTCDDLGINVEDVVESRLEVEQGAPARDAAYGRIAAVMKATAPERSDDGTTSDAHVSVDGYTALTGDQAPASDEHVLPIAQRNGGWETAIRAANFGDSEATVSLTLYSSGQIGVPGEATGPVTRQVGAGETTTFNLADYVAEGWVGTAFISSDQSLGAVTERHKASEEMLMYNASRPAAQESGDQYSALVFQDYNYWNTGISIANTGDEEISLTVDYHNASGEVPESDEITIPARAMDFVYHAGTGEMGLDGFVGSAVLSADGPFHASIDQVKYFGDDPDVGQAMSYIADDRAASGPDGESLAAPLFQKGNPDTGSGDTSGIQLFNVSDSDSVTANVWYADVFGNLMAPSADGPDMVELDPNESRIIYAHHELELIAGFQGSVLIEVTGGGSLVGVSNNVNYEVGGDGSGAFNLVVAGQTSGTDTGNGADDSENGNGDGSDQGPDVEIEISADQPEQGMMPSGDIVNRARAARFASDGFPLSGVNDPDQQDIYEFLVDLDAEEFHDYVDGLVGQQLTEDEANSFRSTYVFANWLRVQIFDVIVRNDGERVGEGIEVTFEVDGVNDGSLQGDTDSNGRAGFGYSVRNWGTDTVTVTAEVHGEVVTAEKELDWQLFEVEVDALALAPLNGSTHYDNEVTIAALMLDQYGIIVDRNGESIDFTARSYSGDFAVPGSGVSDTVQSDINGVAEFSYSRSQPLQFPVRRDEITAVHQDSESTELQHAEILWSPDFGLPDIPEIPGLDEWDLDFDPDPPEFTAPDWDPGDIYLPGDLNLPGW